MSLLNTYLKKVYTEADRWGGRNFGTEYQDEPEYKERDRWGNRHLGSEDTIFVDFEMIKIDLENHFNVIADVEYEDKNSVRIELTSKSMNGQLEPTQQINIKDLLRQVDGVHYVRRINDLTYILDFDKEIEY